MFSSPTRARHCCRVWPQVCLRERTCQIVILRSRDPHKRQSISVAWILKVILNTCFSLSKSNRSFTCWFPLSRQIGNQHVFIKIPDSCLLQNREEATFWCQRQFLVRLLPCFKTPHRSSLGMRLPFGHKQNLRAYTSCRTALPQRVCQLILISSIPMIL